jgi:hypothetical protein
MGKYLEVDPGPVEHDTTETVQYGSDWSDNEPTGCAAYKSPLISRVARPKISY